MNVDLPIFHNPFDWVIITVGSIIVNGNFTFIYVDTVCYNACKLR